jgi:signal transduction histidine kinase/CheY-like chemotaxis protein
MSDVDDDLRSALTVGGDAGRSIAAFDWSATTLGPMAAWPFALRQAVALMLRTPFPVHVSWGPDLVLLHNDAFRSVLGSTRSPAIGRGLRDCFASEWESFIAPRLRSPLERGETSWSHDEMLVLDRHGWDEEVHVASAYVPIGLRSDGGAEGLFAFCLETTDEVVSRRRSDTLIGLDRVLDVDHADVVAMCAAAVDHLATSIDSPVAVVIEPGDSVSDVVAVAGAVVDGSEVRAGRSELDAMVSRPGGSMVSLAELGLTPFDRDDWPHVADLATVHEVGDHRLVLGRHPGLWHDDRYSDHNDAIAAKLRVAAARVEFDRRARADHDAHMELDRVRDALLSDVSHELRTPLALISGSTRELRHDDGLTDDERARLWGLTERNIDRLRRLVESLLAYGRLEAGHLEPQFEPCDLARLTADSCHSFVTEFRRAGIDFDVAIEPLAGQVEVDPDLWETVVLNLLSNAYKFTLAGRVAVRLEPDGEHRVRFTVSDTGVGIAPEHRELLFERFGRVRDQQARTDEGAGIGLALVAAIVDRHGGSIAVDSTPGVGTTMTVVVPTGGPEQPERAETTSPREHAADALDRPVVVDRTKRLLVVDDSDDLLSLLELVLSRHWVVHTASNGEHALDVLEGVTPDLVITDHQMPIVDGPALVRTLRERADTVDVPIILLTGRADADPAVHELIDAVVRKPFTTHDLVTTARSLLTR